jgi:signal transduction histidine kinase
MTATVSGIVVLFSAVALIQYRWNLQIRRATEVRLGANLESVMVKWHLNLYREFSTICIALEVGPDSGAQNHWNDYLRRYEAWRSAAIGTGSVENIYSNPDIVSDIYIYETSRVAAARLVRLDPDADRIDNSAAPAQLDDLLARLKTKSGNLRLALSAWMRDDSSQMTSSENDSEPTAARNSQRRAITGWQFEESIPAIVHPILHNTNSRVNSKSRVDWLVVVLNRDAIMRRVFPELTQRYFESNHGLEYKLAVVVVGKASHLLYSSDRDFGIQEVGGSDSVMNVFGPPPESTEGSFWQVMKGRESLRGEEWRSFSGPVWFPVFQQTSDPRHWELFLKHRTGSLEGTVTKVWHANLLIGSVMLAMLASSLLLVIIAAQRVRALAVMRLDFVTSISHELRTPLAGILASGQNLCDGFARDPSQYGALITAQTRQLIGLVDQILLFASTHDGKTQYCLTAVSVADVFEHLRKTTFAVLGAAGFDVECRLEENLRPVLADQEALSRCLRSLIENAAKYSGGNRWICLSAEADESGHDHTGIRIVVVDHGIGIDHSDLQHIFEPFYRTSAAVAAQIHGSGLGLSIANHIVRGMGGRLSVSSEVGRGSAFTLHLKVV